MRIYNADTDKKANKVTIYLTLDEAKEMRDSLEALLNDSKKLRHEHIPDQDFKREITVCIYNENNLSGLDDRSKKLILQDQ
jgi:hypothetical protein